MPRGAHKGPAGKGPVRAQSARLILVYVCIYIYIYMYIYIFTCIIYVCAYKRTKIQGDGVDRDDEEINLAARGSNCRNNQPTRAWTTKGAQMLAQSKRT